MLYKKMNFVIQLWHAVRWFYKLGKFRGVGRVPVSKGKTAIKDYVISQTARNEM